jgi:hypothetical protein
VAFVGLRIGATLALHAAAARGGVNRLVLWSPFRSGRAYVRELKAFARLSRKDHPREADEGPDIHAAGYLLPGPVARALERLDLDALSRCPAPHVLVVDRNDRPTDPLIGERLEKLGSSVERIAPPGTGAMLEQAPLSKAPAAALDAIANWLGDWRSSDRPATESTGIGEGDAEWARGSYISERAVRFGPDRQLFGILSEPNDSGGAAPAVILLNTNFEYRVGPHRLYVPLARELAARGHVVFRYDLGGIGDSATPPGASENVAYPGHALEDARAAVAFIKEHAPGRRVIVAGLCSGGWHAFCAAREGLGVDAIAAVNAPLYLREGASGSERWTEYQEIASYRSALRDPARWAKALRGGSAYGSLVRLAVTCVGRTVASRVDARFGSRPLDGLARDLDDISANGITSCFVFSRGDAGLEYFQRHSGPAFRRRDMRTRIRHVVVDGADHTFSSPAAQRALWELLLDFIARQTSSAPGSDAATLAPVNSDRDAGPLRRALRRCVAALPSR